MNQHEIDHVIVLTDAYRAAVEQHCVAERAVNECRARLETYIESHRGITLKRVSVDQMPPALPEKPVEERGARPTCVNAPVNYQQVYAIAGVPADVMYRRVLKCFYDAGVGGKRVVEELAGDEDIFAEDAWWSATDIEGRKRLIDNFVRQPVKHGVLRWVAKGTYEVLRTDWVMPYVRTLRDKQPKGAISV